MAERHMEFVGGRQDGNRVTVADPPPAEVHLPTQADGIRSEVYELRDDGRYHFRGYGFRHIQPPMDAAARREWERDMRAVVQGLSDAVERLEAFCQRSGGYLNLDPLHGWTIRKTD